MDVQIIKTLMTEFKQSGLGTFGLKCEEFELSLTNQTTLGQAIISDTTTYKAQNEVKNEIQEDKTQKNICQGTSIIAPMVGTVFMASAPEKAPFVTVGSKVKKGDVVCIIEAMKLMNEVEAECDGEIVEICVQNEAMVEYEQPLFIIKA